MTIFQTYLPKKMILFRELSNRFRSPWQGFIALLIEPLLFLGVYYVALGFILGSTERIGVLSLLCGQMAYCFIRGSVSAVMIMPKKYKFLIVSRLISWEELPTVALFVHGLIFILLLIIAIMLSGDLFFKSIATNLPILACTMLFGTFFVWFSSYFLMAISIIFHDAEAIITLGFRLLLFISPIFFDGSRIPDPYQSIYLSFPLNALIQILRSLLIKRESPQLSLYWGAFVFIALLAFLKLLFGKKLNTRLAECL
jgi:lipopolysaccharide transport system permease protein